MAEKNAMAKKRNTGNRNNTEKFSFFTVKEEVTARDRLFMSILFILLFAAILINKITGTETVPLLLLAAMGAVLSGACLTQLKQPMTKRKARATMILGLMCLAMTFVILFIVVKPLFS